MKTITELAMTDLVTGAVNAKLINKRSFMEHWKYHVDLDERTDFPNGAAFVEACNYRVCRLAWDLFEVAD